MYVSGNSPAPDFGFTIGLFATHDHPEIVVVGLGREMVSWLLTHIAEQVRDGRRFDDVREFDRVLENQYGCRFRALSRKLRLDHLGTAIWFYQGTAFPALQAFVPDVNRRYRWEEGVDGNASAQFLKEDPLRRKTMKS
jgi:hypothetical protein